MLELAGVHAAYGRVGVLAGVDLAARAGEIHCLAGRNGAGKTTTLRAVMGLVVPGAGRIALDGADLTGVPAHRIAARGIGYVPQGRRLFPDMTVAENLEMGRRAGTAGPAIRDRMIGLFPRLGERLDQRAHSLSGGEQQMLAVARALSLEPRVLLLDEPTEGLQPSMTALIRDVTLRMRDAGLAVVLVESRIDAITALADRVTLIDTGRTRGTLTRADLAADPARLRRHLGV